MKYLRIICCFPIIVPFFKGVFHKSLPQLSRQVAALAGSIPSGLPWLLVPGQNLYCHQLCCSHLIHFRLNYFQISPVTTSTGMSCVCIFFSMAEFLICPFPCCPLDCWIFATSVLIPLIFLGPPGRYVCCLRAAQCDFPFLRRCIFGWQTTIPAALSYLSSHFFFSYVNCALCWLALRSEPRL